MKKFILFINVCVLSMLPSLASALEFPILPIVKGKNGELAKFNGMEIGAVYLQPVVMEPVMAKGLLARNADVHLEADIHATEDNRNGFAPGAWIPYLHVHYKLTMIEGNNKGKTKSGDFSAMIANDGPHYGANVKLLGAGNYRLKFTITPPKINGHPFMRHVDKETGVAPWYKPFSVKYKFTYSGIGKKGGY